MSEMDGISISVSPVLDLGGVRFTLDRKPWITQGFRCVISGTPGGGKSYLMAVIAEEVHDLGLPFVIIDPEGEHSALRELQNVIRVGSQGDIEFSEYWISMSLDLTSRGIGVVVDLSDLSEQDWPYFYTRFASSLLEQQRRTRQSLFLFLEEVHLFAPQKSTSRVRDSLLATKQLARRGRKLGISTVMASQRPADVEKDILAQANVRFFGRIEIEADYEAVRRYLPAGVRLHDLRDLDSGEFFLSVSGNFNRVRIRERRTPDLGGTPAILYQQRTFFDLIDVVEAVRQQYQIS